ncbi:glycosyltransferase family 2 protein [Halobacillus ihumii]|uniref:glycosyltransferase family 2 protein n=1 Tax=Halobacillus ihumii TaxID=2686092 RepID=UPI0013D88B50|nr:glycosyltransferase family 2 protein [Halobacillus ihumii]
MNHISRVLVTIVIPTYNRGHLIDRTIKSVLNQTYTNFELLIVDDASQDNTSEVVSSYKDERIRYIRLENNSKGTKPRNIGIKQSKGKFIALLDSDDEWVPNKLESQLSFIDQYKEESFLCFTDVIFKRNEVEKFSMNNPIKDSEDIMDYILLGGNCVQTSTYMFPSELGKRVLFGLNIKKHQDWDFCLRLQQQGAKFISLSEPLSIYNVDERGDRIANNSKYKLSLEWLNKVSDQLSEQSYYAFLANYVSSALIINHKRRKALYYYLKAFQKDSISLIVLIKGLIKCVIPLNLFRKRFR